MKLALPLAALFALDGCTLIPPANPPAPPADGLAWARLGQAVTVGGPRVTPLRVIEDSRCPSEVQCVWAGQVRLSVRIETGAGASTRELTSGQGEPVADGSLTLVAVEPPTRAEVTIPPEIYRFGFRFDGGL
jgi:hypothetical protein